jgi:hypothetical protein
MRGHREKERARRGKEEKVRRSCGGESQGEEAEGRETAWRKIREEGGRK